MTRFNFQLVRIIDVLICAAAAAAEIRTVRFDAMWRWFAKVDHLRFGELLSLADHFCRNYFVFNREWNENSLAVFARDTFSAKSNVLYS